MKIQIKPAASKPRNVFAMRARQRRAGQHRPAGEKRQQPQKDLLQRLREAGL
jgi:hypothetical protein